MKSKNLLRKTEGFKYSLALFRVFLHTSKSLKFYLENFYLLKKQIFKE